MVFSNPRKKYVGKNPPMRVFHSLLYVIFKVQLPSIDLSGISLRGSDASKIEIFFFTSFNLTFNFDCVFLETLILNTVCKVLTKPKELEL